jgi:hypothetical protein
LFSENIFETESHENFYMHVHEAQNPGSWSSDFRVHNYNSSRLERFYKVEENRFLKLPPHTLPGFDLTTHSSRLLSGRRRRYHKTTPPRKEKIFWLKNHLDYSLCCKFLQLSVVGLTPVINGML